MNEQERIKQLEAENKRLMKAYIQQTNELVRLRKIEEAAWKLAEHPDSEAKKAALLKLFGVEL